MPGSSSPSRTLARSPSTGRPFVILLSGLPGSGKSFVGRLIAGQLSARIVENDSIRRKLFASRSYTASENRQVYRAALALIRDAVTNGHDVVFDATNLTEAARKAVLTLTEEIDAGLAI